MGLDIRLPIGMLFTIFGIMLIVFGVFSNPSLYAQSLGINIRAQPPPGRRMQRAGKHGTEPWLSRVKVCCPATARRQFDF